MPYDFDSKLPIYQQIIDLMKQMLANGKYLPGSKVPSVRELAMEFSVNPNTVQKALQELERDGYLFAERTSGRFVTKDEKLLEDLRVKIPHALIKQFIADMSALGINHEEIIDYLKKYLQGGSMHE